MGLKRDVSLSAALAYQGKGPYWTYILHRIGGSALFIFFTIYILALVGVQAANGILSNWIFQLIFLPFMGALLSAFMRNIAARIAAM